MIDELISRCKALESELEELEESLGRVTSRKIIEQLRK